LSDPSEHADTLAPVLPQQYFAPHHAALKHRDKTWTQGIFCHARFLSMGALSVYAAATISAHADRAPFFAISTENFAKKTKIFRLSTQFFTPNLLQNAQMFAIIKWKYFFTAQTAIHEKISEE
jgi:hypothetical protein